MTYSEIKIKLTKCQLQLSELGCEPVADVVEEAIYELNLAYVNSLIK